MRKKKKESYILKDFCKSTFLYFILLGTEAQVDMST